MTDADGTGRPALQAVDARDLPEGAWDRFCAASDDAWFFHTQDYQQYAHAYRPDWRPQARSFALVDPEGIVAACPLLEEQVPDTGGGRLAQFGEAYGGMGGCPAPALRADLGPRRRQQVLDEALRHADLLATASGVVRGSWRIFGLAPNAVQGLHHHNPLVRAGCLDTSLATQLIDLRVDESVLWHGLTKGHRYDARRGAKGIDFQVVDAHHWDPDAFGHYPRLHAKAAGRMPRPAATYERQRDWVQQGHAILIGARQGEAWLAFAYLIVHKHGAYYMSGCEDPDGGPDRPIGHALQWHAMQALKQRGVATYEIGWQTFGPQPHAVPTAKELAIAAFKRRFGGRTVPLWSGERFYSVDVLRRVLDRRAEALVAHAAAGQQP